MAPLVRNVFGWEPEVNQNYVQLSIFVMLNHDVLRFKIVKSSSRAVYDVVSVN